MIPLLIKLGFYFSLLNPLIPRKSRVCLCYGKEVEKYYDFLEESQWWSREEIENYQNEKLRKLIKHAYNNVPYYRKVFKENNLRPNDITTADDLEKIPILTKKIIRENFPEKIVAQNISKVRIAPASTGGSTGKPLVFFRDKLSQDISWAAMLRFFKWIGFEWEDRIAYFWRVSLLKNEKRIWYANTLDKIQYSWVSRLDKYDAFRVGEKELAIYVERLIRTQPEILRGYVNVIVALARYCQMNGIDKIRPKAVTTTAEVLHRRERKLLEEQFRCDVYDQYAGGECFAISAECEQHNGLHINSEHCIVEIVDEKNNVLSKGERGKIIVTDLDNFVMPFIRYSNGDFGSLKKEMCCCKRGLPLINPIEGRVFGMLKGKDSKVVHGEFFANLLEESGWYKNYNVEAFQVVQESTDSLVWNIVCDRYPGNEDKNILISHCKEYFGDISVNLKFISEIPLLPSGKRELTCSQVGPRRHN